MKATIAPAPLLDAPVADRRNWTISRLRAEIEGLSRSIDWTLPAPEKPKKAPSKKTTQPVPASMPRRRDVYAGVGAIAVRALNTATSADAMMADMVRRGMGGQPAVGTTVIHNRM